ncbi:MULTISPECIES: glycosyltransferase [unclassified Sphingobacterium]|uniref:glycosyltransferase n=1 Tax=unclassified Sphingobacterium TaxID=2609468 RepID=UPI0025DB09CC|nr:MULTISPECIES: glycosyltransferase [unclassified Sphingobacterium]
MIKVAFFAEMMIEDFDGASRTMFQLINRIDSTKFEFLFIYGNGPEQIDDHLSLRIPYFHIPFNRNYTMAVPAIAKKMLKQQLKEFDPDVIHIATPSMLGSFALKYAEKHNIPTLTIYHTHFISYIDYYLKNTPFLIKPTKKEFIKQTVRFYNKCTKVYVPSVSISKELKHLGIQPDKLTLWQRGIDTELFSPKKKDNNYLRKVTKNKKQNILFASRLEWEKNLVTLIDIYHKCKERDIDCNFIIAGDGTAKAACMEQMPDAYFLGKLSHKELAICYASSTLFLFPSITETYGNVVIEAMASGLPCVISNDGGSADFIIDGENGFKCNAEQAEDYVDKIQLLLSDKNLRKKFKKAGLKYSKQHNWQHLSEIYFRDISDFADMTISSQTAYQFA